MHFRVYKSLRGEAISDSIIRVYLRNELSHVIDSRETSWPVQINNLDVHFTFTPTKMLFVGEVKVSREHPKSLTLGPW